MNFTFYYETILKMLFYVLISRWISSERHKRIVQFAIRQKPFKSIIKIRIVGSHDAGDYFLIDLISVWVVEMWQFTLVRCVVIRRQDTCSLMQTLLRSPREWTVLVDRTSPLPGARWMFLSRRASSSWGWLLRAEFCTLYIVWVNR